MIDARFRLFGLITTERKLSPSEVDGVYAVFGPQVLELDQKGRARRQTHLAWLPTPPPQVSLGKCDVRFAAQCYWSHAGRNRRILQVASALSAGRTLSTRQSADVNEFVRSIGDQTPNVTILVERPRHALALSDALPDWPVVIDDNALTNLPRRFRTRVKHHRRQWAISTNQIVLADAADQIDGSHPDIVIYAAGGESITNIPPSWLTGESTMDSPLLIVDFDDNHNRDTRKLRMARKQAYLDRDIYPVGITAAMGRTAQFLSRQCLGGAQ